MRYLHLVLKHKWFDMIERGEKPEEYREITPYWTRRIGIYDYVVFHRGYTSRTLIRRFLSVHVGTGNPKWGAPAHPVYIIKYESQQIITPL